MADLTLALRLTAEAASALQALKAVQGEVKKTGLDAKAAADAAAPLTSVFDIPPPASLMALPATLSGIRLATDQQLQSTTALSRAQDLLGGALQGASVDMTQLAGIETAVSAATEEEVITLGRLSAELEALRQRIAPAITAEEMLAQANQKVDAAVKAGLISQAEANALADQARAKFGTLPTTFGQVEKGAFAAAGGARMLGQQLSQVFQQTAATGNFAQALAIQLPDIAMGFGNIAIAGSVIASFTLPMIIGMLGGGKSAADQATEANKAYAQSFDALKSDLTEAKALEDEYAAAVKSGSAQRIKAAQDEAAIRLEKLKLDILDQKESAAKAAQDQAAAQQELQSATMAKDALQKQVEGEVAVKQATIETIATIQKKIEVAKGAGQDYEGLLNDLDVAKSKYQQINDAIEIGQAALRDQTVELAKQQTNYDKTSVAYRLIGAEIQSNKDKLNAVETLLQAIAAGTHPIITGLDGAATSAGGLTNALETALGVAQSLEATIRQMNFSNIAKAAELAALKAGQSPQAAKAAGAIAGKQAELAPMLSSRESDVRQVARDDLRNFIDSTKQSAATDQALADAIKNWNKSHSGASGGSGGAKPDTLPALSADAKKTLSDLDAQIAAINAKVKAGLMTTADAGKAITDARAKANDDLSLIIAKIEQMGPAGAAAARELKTHLLSATDAMAKEMADLSTSMGDNFKSSFIDAVMGSQDAFSGFIGFMERKLLELSYDKFLSGPIGSLMDGIVSGLGSLFGGGTGGTFKFALGGVPAMPEMVQPVRFGMGGIPALPKLPELANTVLAKATPFAMPHGDTGVAGEAGPEAIMPLKSGGVRAVAAGGLAAILPLTRAGDGSLAVDVTSWSSPGLQRLTAFASGGIVGGGQYGKVGDQVEGSYSRRPIVNIQTPAGHEARVEERVEGGSEQLTVVFDAIENHLASRIGSGRGSLAASLAQTFGIGRVAR